MDDRFQAVPLNPITAPDLWPFVRSQLLRVEGRTEARMLPEQVYQTWILGNCNVFVFRWEGRNAGAAVLQNNRRDDGHPELWVWGLSLEGHPPRELPAVVNEWLKVTAQQIGAASVSMKSARRGWGRYLEGMGWKPTLVEYTLEV